MDNKCETWKEIPHFEGLYEASNFGRIRTIEGKTTIRSDGCKRVWKQRIIKPKTTTTRTGRKNLMVTLWKDGEPHYFLVSRLIASTYHGDLLLTDMTVNHIDGDYLNNYADNLEWLSRGDNIRYGFLHGQYKKRAKAISICKDGNIIDFISMRSVDLFLDRYKGYTRKSIKAGKQTLTSACGDNYSIIYNDLDDIK